MDLTGVDGKCVKAHSYIRGIEQLIWRLLSRV